MKKIILAILAVGTIATANAQKGSWLLYGNVGLTNIANQDKSNNFNWNVSPGIGYQFNEHWTAGLNLSWSQNTYKATDSNNRYANNMYRGGVFVRYTKNINDMFFVFGQADASYEGWYSTDGDQPSFNKSSGFLIDVIPAVGMNIGCGAALTFSIGGLSYETVQLDKAPNSTNTFNFTFGQTVNIGIQKNFGCHHMEDGKMHHHRMHHRGMHRMHDRDEDDDNMHKSKKAKSSDDDDE